MTYPCEIPRDTISRDDMLQSYQTSRFKLLPRQLQGQVAFWRRAGKKWSCRNHCGSCYAQVILVVTFVVAAVVSDLFAFCVACLS